MEDSRSPRGTTRLPGAIKAGPSGPPIGSLPQRGVLAGLSVASLKNLAAHGSFHRFPVGTEIIREGDLQNRFYVVVEGKLAISAHARDMEMSLSEAYPGECLGEVSLLEPGPASASVRVVKDALLWSMDITNLRTYLAEHAGGAGALLMGMATCLSGRLRQANRLIARNHMMPVELLPKGRERAITAGNAPVHPGFFDKLKHTLALKTKIRISTKIKM